ncbi:transcriptional regulator, TetR family [Chryseolinea serpens]|uniref:Transcriptional regulator, TetR family n=1 Tax=Chryseolinea serpens TaxID=947013 RepID=A0A1M5QYJ7_9BACT|nr:TetR/AcrR family transcriptional regulator [Chryseolinea serpens]SHH18946.1 transcriptional regulator, TetR family [Chryseolinea serpens]
MDRSKNASAWTEEAYTLFAKEGADGIQIERLARILQLNKSGFYHYFGDLEGFFTALLHLHEQKADVFLEDLRHVKTIDPEYLHAVVRHKVPILFQVQLIQTKTPAFVNLASKIDAQEDLIVREVWTDYLGFHDNEDLAMQYFNLVRDMFYTRMSFQNLCYPFLHGLMTEAKVLMQQFVNSNLACEADG